MKIVKDKIEITELKEMSEKMFGNLVKAMVDVEKEILAVDAPMHSDLLEFLIEQENCEPKNLWGINFYPEKTGDDFIEFDSMMNLKPGLGNKSRGIEDEKIREKIIEIVGKLIKK
jgi:phage pi2 protein 07